MWIARISVLVMFLVLSLNRQEPQSSHGDFNIQYFNIHVYIYPQSAKFFNVFESRNVTRYV